MHVGQSSRRQYSYNWQRMANCQDHKIKRYVDTDRTQIGKELEMMKKRKFKPEKINVNSMQQL